MAREIICEVNQFGLVTKYTDTEIVRCGDCQHFRAVRCKYSDFDRTVEFCNLTDLPMERSSFCSSGERVQPLDGKSSANVRTGVPS